MSLILCQLHAHSASQGGNLHGISLAIFDIMTAVSLVILFLNPDSRQHLIVIPHSPSRPGVPLADGHLPDAVRPLKDQDRVQTAQAAGAVRAGHAVAHIAAYGSDVAQLGTARHVHRVPQHGNVLLNHVIIGNMGKCGGRTYDNGPVLLHSYALQFLNPVNAYQRAAGQLSLPDFNQHIAASGDDHCLRVFH